MDYFSPVQHFSLAAVVSAFSFFEFISELSVSFSVEYTCNLILLNYFCWEVEQWESGFLFWVFWVEFLWCWLVLIWLTSFQRNFSSNRTGLKQMISTCLLLKAIYCIRASGCFYFFLCWLFSLLQPSYTFLLHYLLHCTIYSIENIFFWKIWNEYLMYKYSWFKVNQTFWR